MTSPSFSIVVPTYQRKALVCDTVRTLCAADYDGRVEIIVVIDGSSDGTAEALAQLKCPLDLRIIEQSNAGPAAARNRGAAEGTGEILLFLDDDMICQPDILAKHSQSHAAGADAVVGDFTEQVTPGAQARPTNGERKGAVEDETIRTPFGVFSGHFSVQRSAFEALGGFDESFTADGGYGYEDTEFAYRLIERFKVRRNRQAVSHHRTSVTPFESVRRARRCAEAERLLLAKHPELRRQLLEWTGALRISTRLRWVIRIPVLPGIVASLAAAAAEIGLRTPLRSSPKIAALCDIAYTLAYWSAVQRNGAIPRL